MIRHAAAFARAVPRKRWANIRVAKCVDVTSAMSKVVDVFGGDTSACNKGVVLDF